MKTPIQEVFEHLRASKHKDSFGEAYCVDWLLAFESEFLEKEKEIIMNAHYAERYGCFSANYYNERFNTTALKLLEKEKKK